MGDLVVKLIVVAIAAWVVWSLLQPRFVFLIRVEGGQATIRIGTVTRAFLDQVTTVCREAGIVKGWVGGVRHGGRVALRFSSAFQPGPRQRLRNDWLAGG